MTKQVQEQRCSVCLRPLLPRGCGCPVVPPPPQPAAATADGQVETIADEYADLLHRPNISYDGLREGIARAIYAALASSQTRIKELKRELQERTREVIGEEFIDDNYKLTRKLEIAAKREADLTAALDTCLEAFVYGGVGDDRPRNRLIQLIEDERSRWSGDNWDYWNFLSEKLQKAETIATEVSAIKPASALTVTKEEK